METKNCLDTMGRKSSENLGMTYCHNMGGNQVFAYTKRQQIMNDDNCLDANGKRGPVKLVRCHGMGGNQAWVYDEVVRTRKLKSFPGLQAVVQRNYFLAFSGHILFQ